MSIIALALNRSKYARKTIFIAHTVFKSSFKSVMALASILKSHKSVNPIFLPIGTSISQEADLEEDETGGRGEDVLLDQNEIQMHSKSHAKRSHHKDIDDKPKKRKGTSKFTQEQILTDQEKSKRTIFVGNLSPTCTKKQLIKIFYEFGKIKSVRFRCARGSKVLPKRIVAKQGWAPDAEQTNEMIAYLVFEKEDSAMKSLEANGTLLEGRHIRVDGVEGGSQHKHSHSIFIGNLPFTITNERLREAFQQCGEIEGVRIVRDKKTGCGKGFGFVLFKEKSGVMFALKQAKSIEIDGRKLRIFKSSENPQRQAISRGKKKFQRNNSDSKQQQVMKQKKRKFHNKQPKKSDKLGKKR